MYDVAMYEVAPLAGKFLQDEGPYLAQQLLLGTLSGWTAHRLVGPTINVHGLQVFFGLAGLYAGSWLWQSFSWQPGPMVGEFSLAASLVGALVLFGFLRLIEVAVAAAAGSS
jgi:uncharacterized membrane protein YeaQ/YmgE (transglycosylase-associated protein family)